jgi:uncharacterized protein YbjT (DUF2867 family)
VSISQLTASQLTATSTAESHQQRLHWLSDRVLTWSGLPVTFLGNPPFTTLAARSIRRDGTLALPFGSGRTSPVSAADVGRVVTTLLRDPAPHLGRVYEPTGPHTLDLNGVAAEFSRALGVPVSYVDVPPAGWISGTLAAAGLSPHARKQFYLG